ncbi:TetR/AcrR family transcriptional regulator [Nitratireductor sp. ZSWI3]|uniref:TetR/AcrR family transcriptional regulator n=1 Tax=Nitratireductor sp. ZSWI3 TaxID=2966359 RepID=UPI00214FA76E|nr:TetR/AcrR family transcriptional regulator [Nitratireductor sp. ZSWI3]MCR4265802.1 TetR/AcrR family transcriptional regulator [Nitratireductor sp. ZSWI3]
MIEATIAMVDRDGADAFSLRALASELGVTPMALYNHVASKRDLLVSAADRILASAKFDHGETNWRLQIEGCFRALREVCIRHPGTARLMEIEGIAPSAVFGPMEVTLDALSKVGLNPTDAMRAYFTLVSFTLAQVSYQTRGPFSHLDPAEAIRKQNLSASLVELVREALPASSSWDFDRAFEYGLSLILDGIEKS